jgi:hypothetical protein
MDYRPSCPRLISPHIRLLGQTHHRTAFCIRLQYPSCTSNQRDKRRKWSYPHRTQRHIFRSKLFPPSIWFYIQSGNLPAPPGSKNLLGRLHMSSCLSQTLSHKSPKVASPCRIPFCTRSVSHRHRSGPICRFYKLLYPRLNPFDIGLAGICLPRRWSCTQSLSRPHNNCLMDNACRP